MRAIAVLVLTWALAADLGAAEESPLWLAVAAPSLRAALEPLATHRSGQGIEVAIVEGGGSGRSMAEAIRAFGRKPKWILLVGDFEEGKEGEPWYLPALRLEGAYWAGSMRRSFYSDSAYGDLDGDEFPDAPVGRIPARTDAEVALVAKKTIAFEGRAPKIEDLDLPFWAGDPAFGPLVQAVVPLMALDVVEKQLPRWVSPWVMVADPTHPLCGWPPDQPELFSARVRRGALLGAIMSHGFVRGVRGMRHGDMVTSYAVEHVREAFASGPPAPPVFVISCSSGNFSSRVQCLTEAMLFAQGGPVAAVGATEESHPLPNLYTGIALAKTLRAAPETFGELWLEAQRAARSAKNVIFEAAIRQGEAARGMGSDFERLKRDQPLLYAFLGDPATRLRRPEALAVEISRDGDRWRYRLQPPEGARELHVGLKVSGELPPRAPLGGAEEARKRLAEANAILGYRSVRAESNPKSWEGVLEEPGTYRFVALTGRAIHVAVEEIPGAR